MLLFNTPIVSSLHNPHVQTEKNPEGKNIFEVCVLFWKNKNHQTNALSVLSVLSVLLHKKSMQQKQWCVHQLFLHQRTQTN